MSSSVRRRASARRARSRWSADDARGVLAELDGSGLSVKQFAAYMGLDPERLYRWRRRLRDAGRPLFVEVAPPATKRLSDAERFVVELGNGRRIRVPAGFDVAELRRLVDALEEARAC